MTVWTSIPDARRSLSDVVLGTLRELVRGPKARAIDHGSHDAHTIQAVALQVRLRGVVSATHDGIVSDQWLLRESQQVDAWR